MERSLSYAMMRGVKTTKKNAITTPSDEREWLTTPEAADRARMPVATLYVLNSRGQGPRRYRVGKRCLYRRTELDLWIESQLVST